MSLHVDTIQFFRTGVKNALISRMNSAVQNFSEMKKVADTALSIYKKQWLLNVLLGYRSWEVNMN